MTLGKAYSALRDHLAEADTVANRARFAEECAALGKWQEALWQEAWAQYDEIVRRPNGGEPVFHLARAKAELELGRAAEALAGLDALRVRGPDYDSPRAHMLHARVLAAVGRTDEAVDAFETIARHDSRLRGARPDGGRAGRYGAPGRRTAHRAGDPGLLAPRASSRWSGGTSPSTCCAGPERPGVSDSPS